MLKPNQSKILWAFFLVYILLIHPNFTGNLSSQQQFLRGFWVSPGLTFRLLELCPQLLVLRKELISGLELVGGWMVLIQYNM